MARVTGRRMPAGVAGAAAGSRACQRARRPLHRGLSPACHSPSHVPMMRMCLPCISDVTLHPGCWLHAVHRPRKSARSQTVQENYERLRTGVACAGPITQIGCCMLMVNVRFEKNGPGAAVCPPPSGPHPSPARTYFLFCSGVPGPAEFRRCNKHLLCFSRRRD